MDEEDLAKIASLSEAQCAEMRVSFQPWYCSLNVVIVKSWFSNWLVQLSSDRLVNHGSDWLGSVDLSKSFWKLSYNFDEYLNLFLKLKKLIRLLSTSSSMMLKKTLSPTRTCPVFLLCWVWTHLHKNWKKWLKKSMLTVPDLLISTNSG